MTSARRLLFGNVADLYDRTRPSYPPVLVDDVLELARPTAGKRGLEVGTGTGKATIPFAERGLPVLGLEPSAPMAAIARRNCAPYPGVEIQETDFENWDPEGERFALVFAGQAWHWIKPELRYVRAAAALRAGGVLATFWNGVGWERNPLRDQLRDAYQREAGTLGQSPGPMHPATRRFEGLGDGWLEEIEQAEGLERPAIHEYDWSCDYTTREYTELLQTHSDHMLLAEDRRVALLDAIAAVLDGHGGVFTVNYVSWLCTAVRSSEAGNR
jgi:SAM-dependent methyltransferase